MISKGILVIEDYINDFENFKRLFKEDNGWSFFPNLENPKEGLKKIYGENIFDEINKNIILLLEKHHQDISVIILDLLLMPEGEDYNNTSGKKLINTIRNFKSPIEGFEQWGKLVPIIASSSLQYDNMATVKSIWNENQNYSVSAYLPKSLLDEKKMVFPPYCRCVTCEFCYSIELLQ